MDKQDVWTDLSLPNSKVMTEKKQGREGGKREEGYIMKSRKRKRQDEVRRNEGTGKEFLECAYYSGPFRNFSCQQLIAPTMWDTSGRQEPWLSRVCSTWHPLTTWFLTDCRFLRP